MPSLSSLDTPSCELYCFYWDPGEGPLAEALLPLVRLRHLDFAEAANWGDDEQEMPEGRPEFTLESFTTAGERVWRDQLDWFLGRSHDTLRELSVRTTVYSGVSSYILEHCRRLTRLEVKVVDGIDDVQDRDALVRLATLPELESLVFVFNADGSGDEWSLDVDYTTPQPVATCSTDDEDIFGILEAVRTLLGVAEVAASHI